MTDLGAPNLARSQAGHGGVWSSRLQRHFGRRGTPATSPPCARLLESEPRTHTELLLDADCAATIRRRTDRRLEPRRRRREQPRWPRRRRRSGPVRSLSHQRDRLIDSDVEVAAVIGVLRAARTQCVGARRVERRYVGPLIASLPECVCRCDARARNAQRRCLRESTRPLQTRALTPLSRACAMRARWPLGPPKLAESRNVRKTACLHGAALRTLRARRRALVEYASHASARRCGRPEQGASPRDRSCEIAVGFGVS